MHPGLGRLRLERRDMTTYGQVDWSAYLVRRAEHLERSTSRLPKAVRIFQCTQSVLRDTPTEAHSFGFLAAHLRSAIAPGDQCFALVLPKSLIAALVFGSTPAWLQVHQ